MMSFHDLNATERDTLLAAATADAVHGDRPHKGAVRDRACTLRDGDLSLAAVGTAIEHLESIDAVRTEAHDRRTDHVIVTDLGRDLLDAAGETLTAAAYDNS